MKEPRELSGLQPYGAYCAHMWPSKEEIREEEEKVLRQVRQSEMIFEKSATANLLPVPC